MRFDHLAIPVSSPTAVADWFVASFPSSAIEVLHWDEEWVFLDFKGTKIAFVKEGQHPAHFAIHIDNPAQLRLLAQKWGKEIAQERDDTLSFYVVGPEGVCVEFVSYLRDFDVIS